MVSSSDMIREREFLQKSIAALDHDSFSKLRDWLLDFDQMLWEKKIERDSEAGKLDFLINKALVEHQEGKTGDI